MDMTMGGMMGMDNSTSAAMMMGTAFVTTLGSANLWFTNWTPTTASSTLGAAIGLFFLSIFSRLLSALRTAAEASWSQSIALARTAARMGLKSSAYSLKQDDDGQTKLRPARTPSSMSSPSLYHAPPFIAAVDVPRSILFMLQAFVGYLLMLAVMTYNAWFFIAIILGMGAGELAFGRYSSGHQSTGIHH